MRGAAACLMGLVAFVAPALAEDQASSATSDQTARARALVAGLIAEAKADKVFADASVGAEPQARHLASGVVCRFVIGQPASIKLLPGRDNVGCTMRRGSGLLALQVQRIPAGVDADKFLTDMVEVVRVDFPGATPIAPSPSDKTSSALRAAHFSAVFQGRPVYVEVCAIHAGPWMVSGHMVALRQDAEASDRITRAEVRAAAMQAAARAD
jgi:hypothetical protein